MGNDIRKELKQLPAMLVKVLGGFMAVIGFGGGVWVVTHGKNSPAVYFGASAIGVALFLIAERMMKRGAMLGVFCK